MQFIQGEGFCIHTNVQHCMPSNQTSTDNKPHQEQRRVYIAVDWCGWWPIWGKITAGQLSHKHFRLNVLWHATQSVFPLQCLLFSPANLLRVSFLHQTLSKLLLFWFFRYYETSAGSGQGVHDMFSGVLAAVVEAKLVKAKPVISTEQSSSKQKWISLWLIQITGLSEV